MFVEKLNAIELHTFLKEICPTVVSVDIRMAEKCNSSVKIAYILNKIEDKTENNVIFYSDNKFCISTGKDYEINKTPFEINNLWKQYLASKFGKEYFDHMRSQQSENVR